MRKFVSSNNDYTFDCKFPNSFLTARKSVFSIVYRNETNIRAYLDFDLDIIWITDGSPLSMIHNSHA